MRGPLNRGPLKNPTILGLHRRNARSVGEARHASLASSVRHVYIHIHVYIYNIM